MPRRTRQAKGGQKGKSMKRPRHWHRHYKSKGMPKAVRYVTRLTKEYPDEPAA